MSEPDWADNEEFREFARSVRAELIPKLRGSAVTVAILGRAIDVKFAVELGASILLDKTIIVVVKPGTPVPNKVVLVADHIIEADLSDAAERDRVGELLITTLGRETGPRRPDWLGPAGS